MTQHRPPLLEQTPTPDVTEKIDRFLAADRPDPPRLVVDLDVVRAKYAALRTLFPDATLYYAVKANPAASVLTTLDLLGAKFDLASEGEIDRCPDWLLRLNVFPSETRSSGRAKSPAPTGVVSIASRSMQGTNSSSSGEPSLNAIIDAFVDDKMKPLEAPGVPQQD